MPIYEYRCAKCANTIEVLERYDSPGPSMCSKCKQPTMRRIVSATSFILKGSGWFHDGYGLKDGQK
jgi:putative FmdB family regulatory protein